MWPKIGYYKTESCNHVIVKESVNLSLINNSWTFLLKGSLLL